MKKLMVTALISLFGVFGVLAAPQPAGAINVFKDCNTNKSAICQEAKGSTKVGSMVQDIINILLYVLGIISVIMIIIGGIRYTTSNGDSAKVTSAKNTVLYSVVGLVVAMLSFVIVNYVVDALIK